MSDLVVIGFDTVDEADKVLLKLVALKKEYLVDLEDAVIVDVQSRMPNCQDPNMAHFTHLEDVYFTYRKIIWTHEVSGTSGSDDWRSPISA